MSTTLRRTATRLAAAGLAAIALGGAAAVGAQAALPSTTPCSANPVSKTFDVLLTLRSMDNDTQTCPSR
ncbi:hypothetical protein F1D05_00545 [Kribbella qitaiheensis]|uniref:Uncharacterized protein n=1 Tax=Kribbella qitaiheensis TaxID=1544730 RepID=A0A7G6WRP5_9ACTN|nr:hypothetical protein [Kribbella qitaiheensis]QNE16660.1 hypothetical protein F1D05_00545 [Kribbella qitaiheensis]